MTSSQKPQKNHSVIPDTVIPRPSPPPIISKTETIPTTTISKNIPNFSSDKISLVVKIEEKLLRVLVNKDATVDDLAKESSKRFFELNDKKPNLQLFDDVGAQLLPTDKVSNLLDLTSSNLRLTSEVTSWIQTPIDDAYEIFCQKMNMLCFIVESMISCFLWTLQ